MLLKLQRPQAITQIIYYYIARGLALMYPHQTLVYRLGISPVLLKIPAHTQTSLMDLTSTLISASQAFTAS